MTRHNFCPENSLFILLNEITFKLASDFNVVIIETVINKANIFSKMH